ncbi:flavin-binding monooxygenase-like family protein [Apiospora sp. TS-2023a]
MEEYDCVVIGAGWYGLAAAKQFHFTQPEKSLIVFDSQASLGGTWADERLYPGLKTNNLVGTLEYPDFPMDTATFGVESGQYIPGSVVNRYLKAYAEEFGIADRIRLETKVRSAEHHDDETGGWTLSVEDVGGNTTGIKARRLIIATGLTSEPFLPHFEGQENYGGKIFHGKYFKQNSDTLHTAKNVTVFGGTKFAWDAVYAYATAGVTVDWVIRSSGHGPCWIAPSYVTPFKKWIEKLATIVDAFWKILGNDALTLMKFDSHPETAKLKPWTEAMFTGASFSILNYDTDFLELVRSGKVRVHISDITKLSPGKIHLSDANILDSDVLLANTGWKHVPALKFLPEGIEKELGLPHTPTEHGLQEPYDLANQQSLVKRADDEILAQFPRLRKQPVWNRYYVPITEQRGIDSGDAVTPCAPLTPYMLHRFVVPPSARFLRRRDVAFAGVISNFSNAITAHLQGLWIGAYFAGALARDPAAAGGLEELRYETVLYNRFGHWRYPTDWGNKNPNFIFDAVPYLDLLLRDLGLPVHRKSGFLAEWTDPYGPEDYRGVNEEWQSKYGKSQSG